MGTIDLNQSTLNHIRKLAKQKSRQDNSLTYTQWLDTLSREHGYKGYCSLKRHVDAAIREAEAAAREIELEEEEALWADRFSNSLVWGTHSESTPEGEPFETLPLTILAPDCEPGSVPWPNSLSRSPLFSLTSGKRKQLDMPLITMEPTDNGHLRHYSGEQWRMDDQVILLAIMLISKRIPYGKMFHFTIGDLEDTFGRPLASLATPIEPAQITRTLWRLSHSTLTMSEFNFRGALLNFVDATNAPEKFSVRFNPRFANFFLSWPIMRF